MNLKDKAVSLISSVKNNWKTPPKGRYMPFKEIVSLSVGGIGVKFITYCVNNMIISIGNSLIGNTIGIAPSAIYLIYIISVLSGFPLTALRARMIDNAKSMKGKYRPYIISMGIPTVLLGIGFIWMPYESMSLTAKCVTVLLFNIGFQFFYNFMTDAYDSLPNVLSPNTIERTDVNAVKAVVENLSPSIASIFLPVVAKLITGDNTLYDLRVYRVLYPPMLLVGFAISVLVYVNTKEKIVAPKNHVIQISFLDAFRAVARNKYFWVISFAGWIGFLETSFNTIIGWMYNYQAACSAGQYAIITAIAGNASFWPNLFAPYLVRKFGKKKILIFTNLSNIIFIAAMLPVVRMSGGGIIWILLAVTFVNQLLSALGHFMNPSLNADIRDYQQYITGERIDGMFATVGLIGSVITLATSSVLPMIYERAGLNETVAVSLGYDPSNVYYVLYNQEYFVHISSVLIIASVVGAALNAVPFFFYDLTEAKQRAMVKVLKIRAMFEDFGNSVLSDELLCEGVDIIEEAKVYYRKQKGDNKEENEKIETAELIINELEKYSSESGSTELDYAKSVVSAGVEGFFDVATVDKKAVKAMPASTAKEKEQRASMLAKVRDAKLARKTIAKYYKDGITEFDSGVFDLLFRADDDNENEIRETLEKMKAAREKGDKLQFAELKTEFADLRQIKNEIKNEIKKANRQYTVYSRAARPYVNAQKVVKQSENYSRYDELLEKYAQLKINA